MAKLSELERQEREAAYRERLRARARQADKDLGLTVSDKPRELVYFDEVEADQETLNKQFEYFRDKKWGS